MFQETPEGSHIWLIQNEEGYLDGWYFSDETENINDGPFDTKEIAEENLGEYCKWLDGPTQTEFVEGTAKEKYDAGYMRVFGKGGARAG